MAYQSNFTGPQIDSVIDVCLKTDNSGNSNLYYLNNLKSYIIDIEKYKDQLQNLNDGTYIPDNIATRLNGKLSLAGGKMVGQITATTDCQTNNADNKALIKIIKPSTFAPIFTCQTSDNRYISAGLNGSDNFAWYYSENSSPIVHITPEGKVYGASWNDFAEYRASDETCAGRVVCECGNGFMTRSNKRLQPGAEIVSDTFGFAIGETEECKTPIAVAGRVLAYPNEKCDSYKPGDPVCSGPNGTVSKMSRREVRKYPERIIGTVSEIPNYEIWGDNKIEVNGRIWIRIK